MSTVILHSSRGDSELRIDPTDTPGHFDVRTDVTGLHAYSRIDASNAGSSGWRRASTVLVTSPEAGLDELCDHLSASRDGWFGEETWTSADGHLQLGFCHRTDHVCVAVNLKRRGEDSWVVSTHIDISMSDMSSMLSRLREVAAPLAAV